MAVSFNGPVVENGCTHSCSARVVLVEDDPALLNALKFSIELEGLSVDGFASGEAMLMDGPPPEHGCLVFDYSLPGMSGLDLLAQLRAKGVRLPAILITTDPSSFVRSRAASTGANIIEKPLLTDVLMTAIRNSLAMSATTSKEH